MYGRDPNRSGPQQGHSSEWTSGPGETGLEDSLGQLGLRSSESYPERQDRAEQNSTSIIMDAWKYIEELKQKVEGLNQDIEDSQPSTHTIIMDASKYIEEWKQKVEGLNQDIESSQSSTHTVPSPVKFTVETLEKGFLINAYSEKSYPGLLVTVLEAFEELGLNVLKASVSCTDRFHLQAVGGEVAAAVGVTGECPERPEEAVCQYYLRTETCKLGASCKFHHPRHGSLPMNQVTLNIHGYPLRPGEEECFYYLKTGRCKFGSTCKYHHPQRDKIEVEDYSTSMVKLHEAKEEEDETQGGLSLLVSNHKKMGLSNPSEHAPLHLSLNDERGEDEDEEHGGLSWFVSHPKEVEILEDVISEYTPLNLALSDGWSNATQIHLVNKDVTELPESPDCPNLTSLFLQTNSDLTSIPISFFELMPKLKEIDLSDTSIKSLPQSFFQLVALQKLFLRNCEVFMELPAQIGQLHNLEVLDLEGTYLIQLPAEIGNLTKLICLKVTFCQCTGDLGEASIVPEGALSKLSQLVELCIDIDPEDSRWEGAVKVVIKELVLLKKLEYLKMYLPQVELLDELTANLPFSLGLSTTGFNLNVGSHMRRVMSQTPLGAEGKSQHWKKHLRYVNGNGSIPSQIKNILKYSDALFLDRHFTISRLSEFGIHNMENLKFCMLGECNELQTILQGSDDDPVLPKLEQLIIYNMKTLTSIYNAPLKGNSLSCLKTLKLHGCAQLRTIFIIESSIALDHLEEIIVEDCPAVLSLITCSKLKSHAQIGWLFPKLKKISLHYLTELQSIFSGLCTAPYLEMLSVYDCPNLKTLSAMEISGVYRLRVIRGEEEWWKALEWNESEWKEDCLRRLATVFVPIRRDTDLETQLAQDPIPEPGTCLDTHDFVCLPPPRPSSPPLLRGNKNVIHTQRSLPLKKNTYAQLLDASGPSTLRPNRLTTTKNGRIKLIRTMSSPSLCLERPPVDKQGQQEGYPYIVSRYLL